MHEINCNPENISNRICAELDLTLARNLNKELECKLQQLKAENEKLKQDLQEETKLGHKAICEEADRFFEVMKLQEVLDEIEKYCIYVKNISYDINDCEKFTYYGGAKDTANHILLDLIKQVKGEE